MEPNNTQSNNKRKKRKKSASRVKRTAQSIIILCLAVIVAISGWNLYKMTKDYRISKAIYDSIAELAMPQHEFDGEIDFEALRKVNPDIVGWLYYADTHINYPVVMGRDNDQYLRLAFDGTWSINGSLFVDAVTWYPFQQFNTIVYGHHMQDGSMFADFKKLKEYSFYEDHPQLELITPEGKFHLMICAFLNQPADSAIYYMNITDDAEKQNYIDLVNSLAMYTTDQKMSIDDRLVVLSTCAYEYQDARYMVIARMVPW